MGIDFNRVQEVFLAAIEAPDPEARRAILDRDCGADWALRQRVIQLLDGHDDPGKSLRDSAQSVGERFGSRYAVAFELVTF